MIETRPCEACGVDFEARRQSSRFCSDRCRQRLRRSPVAAGAERMRPGELVDATRRQLAAAGAVDTTLGQMALLLAARLESPLETGNSVASVSREFRTVMGWVTDQRVDGFDPVDELRARRDRRRRSP